MTAEPRHGHKASPPSTGTGSDTTSSPATPQPDYTLSFKDGRPLPIRTHLMGGPQDGRVDLWFTLAPEQVPEGWVFPRRVLTSVGEVPVADYYRRRPGQVPAPGAEVFYDFDHTGPEQG